MFRQENLTLPIALISGCDIPLSKTDEGFKFSASSSGYGKEASYAKLDEPRGWCAKTEVIYREYLQVNLSRPQHIAAIQTQGFKYSYRDFYVKKFFVGYSLEGKVWKAYKSSSKRKRSMVKCYFCFHIKQNKSIIVTSLRNYLCCKKCK